MSIDDDDDDNDDDGPPRGGAPASLSSCRRYHRDSVIFFFSLFVCLFRRERFEDFSYIHTRKVGERTDNRRAVCPVLYWCAETRRS